MRGGQEGRRAGGLGIYSEPQLNLLSPWRVRVSSPRSENKICEAFIFTVDPFGWRAVVKRKDKKSGRGVTDNLLRIVVRDLLQVQRV